MHLNWSKLLIYYCKNKMFNHVRTEKKYYLQKRNITVTNQKHSHNHQIHPCPHTHQNNIYTHKLHLQAINKFIFKKIRRMNWPVSNLWLLMSPTKTSSITPVPSSRTYRPSASSEGEVTRMPWSQARWKRMPLSDARDWEFVCLWRAAFSWTQVSFRAANL